MEENDDNQIYNVVLNDEEQYSVWLADQDLPLGWRLEGTQGTKKDCLSYIAQIWTDMRPLSLRKTLEG